MDKLNVLMDNMYYLLKVIHKQASGLSVSFKETVDKGQKFDRKSLADIDKAEEKALNILLNKVTSE